jgi:hypothetical protein
MTLSLASKLSGGAFSSGTAAYTSVAAVGGVSTFPGAISGTAESCTFTVTDNEVSDIGVITANGTLAFAIISGTTARVPAAQDSANAIPIAKVSAPLNPALEDAFWLRRQGILSRSLPDSRMNGRACVPGSGPRT